MNPSDHWIESYITAFLSATTPGNSAHLVADDDALVTAFDGVLPKEIADHLKAVAEWVRDKDIFQVLFEDQSFDEGSTSELFLVDRSKDETEDMVLEYVRKEWPNRIVDEMSSL